MDYFLPVFGGTSLNPHQIRRIALVLEGFRPHSARHQFPMGFPTSQLNLLTLNPFSLQGGGGL